MPDEDNNFGGSLMLDFRKYRRHVQPKNMFKCNGLKNHRTTFISSQ